MGLEVIEQDINPGVLQDIDEFEDEDAPAANVDARRKLEDKIEELRLMRELREFDFDA